MQRATVLRAASAVTGTLATIPLGIAITFGFDNTNQSNATFAALYGAAFVLALLCALFFIASHRSQAPHVEEADPRRRLAKRAAALHHEASTYLTRRAMDEPQRPPYPDPPPGMAQPGADPEWRQAVRDSQMYYDEQRIRYDRFTLNEFQQLYAGRIRRLVQDATDAGEFVDPKLRSRADSMINLLVCRDVVQLLGAMSDALSDKPHGVQR